VHTEPEGTWRPRGGSSDQNEKKRWKIKRPVDMPGGSENSIDRLMDSSQGKTERKKAGKAGDGFPRKERMRQRGPDG